MSLPAKTLNDIFEQHVKDTGEEIEYAGSYIARRLLEVDYARKILRSLEDKKPLDKEPDKP